MLNVVLVRPSRYDDDGYVVHHAFGVLPSNTLYALNGLCRAAAVELGLELRIRLVDEAVELARPEKLMRSALASGSPTLVCLVGVQTNQFPRAMDLARRFRALGAQVIIGGFHVSGSLATLGITPELQAGMDLGVSFFAGEAEGRLEEVLADACRGTLKALYRAEAPVALGEAWAMPLVDEALARRFALAHAGTLDTSRGCVFKCSFCTIINVHGNVMRARDPALIEEHIRAHYPRVRSYFFTDDNLARSPYWRDLFERLIRLRQEGLPIDFMMQVDVPSYRIPDFARLAAEAGCYQVFIGVESLDPEALAAASKRQNDADRYDAMRDAWRSQGITINAAYIIGFPGDTVESVHAAVRALIDEVQPDQASFFMLTPLPGSVDHAERQKHGEWMSPDLNTYDTFRPSATHPRMSADEWASAYWDAWRTFYSEANLTNVLKRCAPAAYWTAFRLALWSAYAALCEHAHPMATGFWRLKGRTERRPGFAVEGRLAYGWRRLRDTVVLGARVCCLLRRFERIWRATWLPKQRRELTQTLRAACDAHSRRGGALARTVRWVTRASLGLGQTQAAWGRFREQLGHGRIWHPRLYWDGLRGSLLLGRDVATLGWLFIVNLALET